MSFLTLFMKLYWLQPTTVKLQFDLKLGGDMAIKNISPDDLKAMLDGGEDVLVVDVRMPWEQDISRVDFSTDIVLDELPQRMNEIPKDKTVVFLCRSGARSMRACQYLAGQGWEEEKLLNLEGGILAWARDIDPDLPQSY
jgi:sulfur-carrier protein adenylyltransferase/sulfurtransferase